MIDTCIGDDRAARVRRVHATCRPPSSRTWPPPGFPPRRSRMCCARTCTSTMWAGTRARSTASGCPRSRRRATSSGGSEWEHWKHLRETDGYHHMDHLADAIDPVMEAGLVEFIDPDFRLTDEVSLIPTPGHTPGHVSVLIESRGQSAVITGDMMHNPIQIAVPDARRASTWTSRAAAQTRVRVRAHGSTTRRTLVIGSHFAEPTAGHIVAGWQGLETEGLKWPRHAHPPDLSGRSIFDHRRGTRARALHGRARWPTAARRLASSDLDAGRLRRRRSATSFARRPGHAAAPPTLLHARRTAAGRHVCRAVRPHRRRDQQRHAAASTSRWSRSPRKRSTA